MCSLLFRSPVFVSVCLGFPCPRTEPASLQSSAVRDATVGSGCSEPPSCPAARSRQLSYAYTQRLRRDLAKHGICILPIPRWTTSTRPCLGIGFHTTERFRSFAGTLESRPIAKKPRIPIPFLPIRSCFLFAKRVFLRGIAGQYKRPAEQTIQSNFPRMVVRSLSSGTVQKISSPANFEREVSHGSATRPCAGSIRNQLVARQIPRNAPEEGLFVATRLRAMRTFGRNRVAPA